MFPLNMLSLLAVVKIFIILQTICLVKSKNIKENEMGKVIFANVIYRHGDRTPINPYSSDPYKNTSYWPVGFGQLTNIGKQQHFKFGQWLRKRYDPLLTDNYNRDIIRIQSTDVDRTLMSAQCNLAGMYPPKDTQVWDEDLRWQPIPIHTTPEKLDNVLAAKAPCPAFEEEYQRMLHSKDIQDLNNTFYEVYTILNKYSGDTVSSLEQIDSIYNTLWIETLYNFTLPSWTKDIFPHPMEEASKYSFVLPTWTKKLARLKSGLLVKDMVSNMKRKKENISKHNHNIKIYSAHDSTIASLMHTMGIYNMINPPYTACLMMELRVNISGNYVVTLFYRNSSTEEPYLLTLPGCTSACLLDQFISLLEPVMPDDWESECQASVLSSYSTFTIVALVVLIILVVVLLTSGVIYWQRRKRLTYCRE